MKLHGLDLFSGIGGLTSALEPWVRPLAYCENDRYAQAVLLSRMADGAIERGPIWNDVRTLNADRIGWPWTPIDIIYGGFPCQDISVAGAGKGLAGERSGLFFEVARLIDELRPSFVFLENVPAITTRGLDVVTGTLTELGYDCRWTVVSAAELGAPHVRKRWFLLAHSNSQSLRIESGGSSRAHRKSSSQPRVNGATQPATETRRTYEEQFELPGVADSDGLGLEESGREERGTADTTANAGWWSAEPGVGRVVDGLPHRVDRVKCLGNAVVPTQAREAFERLMFGELERAI